MSITKWLNKGMGQNLIAILKAIKEKVNQLDWQDIVVILGNYFNNETDPQHTALVNDVLTDLQLSDEVEEIKNFWNKLSPDTKNLVKRLKNLPGTQLKWPILDKGVCIGQFKGPWDSVLNFDAGADLNFQLNILDAEAEELEEMGVAPEEDDLIVMMGLDGKINVGGGFNVPVGFVGVKGDASAIGTAELDYLFSNNGNDVLAGALVKNITHLPSPFSAKDISRAAKHKLKAVQLEVTGNLNASMGLQMGRTWETSFPVKSKDLAPDAAIGLDAGFNVGYKAALTLSGSWHVLSIPIGPDSDKIKVSLRHHASSVKTTAFSLDSSLEITGLDAIGTALIQKYAPDPGGLIAQLEPYTNVGQLLRTKLQNSLANLLNANPQNNETPTPLDPLITALLNTVTGVTTHQQLSDTIFNTLETTAQNEIDILEGNGNQTAAILMEKVADKLNLQGTLKTQFINAATQKINTLIQQLKNEIQTTVSNLLNNAQTESDKLKLLKPLSDIGENIDKLLKKADNISQEILQPILRLLTRYRDIRAKVSRAVESAARLKLGLSLAHTVSATDESKTLLELEIDTAVGGEIAQEYYKKLMAGQLGQLLNQLRNGEVKGIELTGGTLEEHINKTISTDVTLNLFGFNLTSKTILSADVRTECDVAGNVLVAVSKSDFQRYVSAFGESRMVQFVNMMELSGAASANDEVKRVFTTGLTLSYQDSRLKKDEVRDFFGSLENIGLVAAGTTQKCLGRLSFFGARKQNKLTLANIGLSMPFTTQHIRQLIQQPQAKVENTAIYQQMHLYLSKDDHYQKFLKVIQRFGIPDQNTVEKIKTIGTMNLIDAAGLENRRSPYYPVSPIPGEDAHYIVMAGNIGIRAQGMWNIVQDIKTCAQTSFANDTAADAKTMKILNKANRQINHNLKEWLKVKGWVPGIFSEKVPATTLAFMVTMANLCGIDLSLHPLIPVIKWSFADGTHQEDLII